MGWVDEIAELGGLQAADRDRLNREARRISVPAGTTVFGPGAQAENLIVVLRGAVRVQHVSDSGRQIVLYRVHAGQTCIMTTACLVAHEAYSAEGVTETAVEAVMVPRRAFDALLGSSAAFRSFVFDAYSRRITDLFLLIDDVAFQRMDIRLAQRLLVLAGGAGSVAITHQQLAAELGTAREVVSRLLQEFRRRGLVSSARGEIVLEDAPGLRRLSEAG
ncbi:Crp/Fnr family transcriptional regulator [Meridianimarinicoccus roseus]|jgi:CRP/FNR family transcriptional regulator|uniref:Crp/Fnr family transcriptional regulator n=1 Tax=Meridianimarinicoccus roseus TaxID=2072018 RepID=A0A2V2LDQ8_9RHOB|nr:Crp/Fnr family transcriptional regulator [Meridianimarinicoccus roseus]PWR03545.1 Crp/Fnr family transcriptional regulator [Meridianimarinicoccus roseus]